MFVVANNKHIMACKHTHWSVLWYSPVFIISYCRRRGYWYIIFVDYIIIYIYSPVLFFGRMWEMGLFVDYNFSYIRSQYRWFVGINGMNFIPSSVIRIGYSYTVSGHETDGRGISDVSRAPVWNLRAATVGVWTHFSVYISPLLFCLILPLFLSYPVLLLTSIFWKVYRLFRVALGFFFFWSG